MGDDPTGVGASPAAAPCVVAPLTRDDRAAWETLARGYKAFYRTSVTDAEYVATWDRLMREDGVLGLAARREGRVEGIAHYLFHTTVWAPKVCYLQDLFVVPQARGQGTGRALITAVAEAARTAGAVRCYWHTQEHNATARALYDSVTTYGGFVRYELVPDATLLR